MPGDAKLDFVSTTATANLILCRCIEHREPQKHTRFRMTALEEQRIHRAQWCNLLGCEGCNNPRESHRETGILVRHRTEEPPDRGACAFGADYEFAGGTSFSPTSFFRGSCIWIASAVDKTRLSFSFSLCPQLICDMDVFNPNAPLDMLLNAQRKRSAQFLTIHPPPFIRRDTPFHIPGAEVQEEEIARVVPCNLRVNLAVFDCV